MSTPTGRRASGAQPAAMAAARRGRAGSWNGDDWEIAHTPRGWFKIYWRDAGWVEAPLGWLYDAMYSTGGYAVHGSESVPEYPAIHGCVRVSIEDAEWLFARIEYGTPVLVHD